MSRRASLLSHGIVAAALAACIASARAQTATVAFFHNTADHAGLFTVPGLTPATVASTKPDTAFNGAVPA